MQSFTFFPLLFLLLAPSLGLNLDGTLLLSFKYTILSDPLSVLDNWDYNDLTPCLWTGVACKTILNELRVTSLILPNLNLLGTIPQDLGLIDHLQTLDLSGNFFNGTLPSSLFNASELQILSLSANAISGSIPNVITSKTLQVLNLSDNALTGHVPASLTSLTTLKVVSLRSNYFSGPVLSGVRFFEVFDVSSNLLNGSLPVDFGGDSLKYLNLSYNKLSGQVDQLFAAKIPKTATIDLSFNDLSGEIPETEVLSNQKTEYYQGNIELCGKPIKKMCSIPSTFSGPPPNVSRNSSSPAIAAIPKTIGSSPLPDSPESTTTTTTTTTTSQSQHGLKPASIAGIAFGDLAGIGALAAVVLFMYHKKKKKNREEASSLPTTTVVKEYKFDTEPESKTVKETRNLPVWPCLSITNGEDTSDITSSESDDNDDSNNNHHHVQHHNETKTQTNVEIKKSERCLIMVDGETELELETLFKASAYVLGSTGGSIVYKAVLQNGMSFAVRRIGECGVEKLKDFENQVKGIAKLRHEHLVRVRGFYWGDDEKLVIYDYVSNGSLASVGYRKIGSSPYHLPFETRLKVAKGVAKGLNYIHEKKHVHGNIKPSNILLTADMEPVISDFGLHLLIHGKQSRKPDDSSRHFGSRRGMSPHTDLQGQSANDSPYIGPAGYVGCTSAYHAPESLKNIKPSPKWDVYSYGILLLELLTGKVFSDRELSQWNVGSVVEDRSQVLRMADVSIRGDAASREEAILAWFKLGLSCASLVPQKRPSMKDAIHVLEKIPCSSHY